MSAACRANSTQIHTQTICRYSAHAVAIDRRCVVGLPDHFSVFRRSGRNASGSTSDHGMPLRATRARNWKRTAAMISRRSLLACAAVAGALLAAPAFAAETIPYTPQAFDAAQKDGKSILVEIHAPWCPTCKAQAPILADLEKDAKFRDLLVVHVDFDSQKDAVRRFGARMQSTLITFKDGKETGRSVGATDRESIADLLGKAI
ncbi:MAG TPA: thioredoxin family protein [Roseiarcus sp.]|nr:thioredoxin family protein [Roseiarcus sp.]